MKWIVPLEGLDFRMDPDPIAEACLRDMRARHMRAELRIMDFMRRTGLTVDEIQMIYIRRTGEFYPQWRWAAQLVPVICAPND